jgi:hypothetical protein
MLGRWLSAIRKRFEPRRVWVSGSILHYSVGGQSWQLAIADIQRIDAYANIEPPSRKFGIVYSGLHTRITTIEDMENFRPVFDEIAAQLGLDAEEMATDIAQLRSSNPIFEKRATVTRAN